MGKRLRNETGFRAECNGALGKRFRNWLCPAKSLGQLQLNDFRGFHAYLYNQSKGNYAVRWSYYYDPSTGFFYPPIVYPETEVDYQLNHYAFWMVVYVYRLYFKPRIKAPKIPKFDCYICEYLGDDLYFSCKGCPIGDCGIYTVWYNAKIEDKPRIARKIAMLKWQETKKNGE